MLEIIIPVSFNAINAIEKDFAVLCQSGKTCSGKQVVSFKEKIRFICTDPIPCEDAKRCYIVFINVGEK